MNSLFSWSWKDLPAVDAPPYPALGLHYLLLLSSFLPSLVRFDMLFLATTWNPVRRFLVTSLLSKQEELMSDLSTSSPQLEVPVR
jgi:hypothetical protein